MTDGVNRYVELLAVIDERDPKRAEKLIFKTVNGKERRTRGRAGEIVGPGITWRRIKWNNKE